MNSQNYLAESFWFASDPHFVLEYFSEKWLGRDDLSKRLGASIRCAYWLFSSGILLVFHSVIPSMWRTLPSCTFAFYSQFCDILKFPANGAHVNLPHPMNEMLRGAKIKTLQSLRQEIGIVPKFSFNGRLYDIVMLHFQHICRST